MIFFQNLKLITFGILTYSLAIQADPINSQVSNSNNNFGFKMMRESLKDDKDLKNRFFFPISAHLALSMVLNGTGGETREKFLKQLEYPTNFSIEQINIQNSNLLNQLIKKAPTPPSEGRRSPVFTIQNSAWTTTGITTPPKYDFNQSFMNILADYYQVPQVTSLDFVDPKSSDVINEWVKKATQGMVPEIIDTNQLKTFLWIFLNATYLEAEWTVPFQPTGTDLLFYLSNAKSIKAPFIWRKLPSRLALTKQAKIVELTFSENSYASSFKAYIILPNTMSDFTKLKDEHTGVWTEDFWTKVFGNLTEKNIYITMPKFSFTDGVEMNPSPQQATGYRAVRGVLNSIAAPFAVSESFGSHYLCLGF